MRSRLLVASLVLAAGLSLISGLPGQPPPAGKGKAAPAAEFALKAARGLQTAPGTWAAIRRAVQAKTQDDSEDAAPFYDDGETRYLMLNLEFADAAACQAFDVPGHKLVTRFNQFADVFVPATAPNELSQALAAQKGLLWYEADRYILPPPARPIPKKETPRSIPDKIVEGGLPGPDGKTRLVGKGVIVAIVDSGLDFRHPDFLTKDAQGQPVSRLIAFWDTTSDAYANGVGEASRYKYPNGAPIGTVYDRDTLTADIRGGKLRIPVWDPNGHGTACAGVAAGNGSGNGDGKKEHTHIGVAPEADLIAVRIGSGDVNNPMLENSFMINAICEWLDEVAGQQPLVVSCSFGGHGGGHDGQTVSERQLSARFGLDKKGRAICVAAGNEGERPMHAGMSVGPKSSPAKLNWGVDGRDGGNVIIYVQTDSDADLGIKLPAGIDAKQNLSSYVHPLTNQVVIELRVPAGLNGLELYSKSDATYVADAYVYGEWAAFADECVEYGKQVGSPGTALNVLTVGSYDWNDVFHMKGSEHVLPDVSGRPIEVGKLSMYSNPGPLRYGEGVKPELVAPGQWYAAAAPLNINPYFGRDSTGLYQRHNGTSAATPYAAGVIALMFQANPNLTWGEVRKILTESVTQDPITTGKCPNPRWGHGKLDYAAVERAVKRARK